MDLLGQGEPKSVHLMSPFSLLPSPFSCLPFSAPYPIGIVNQNSLPCPVSLTTPISPP